MIKDIHAHLFHPSWYSSRFQDAIVDDFLKRQKKNSSKTRNSVKKTLFRMLSDNTGELTIKIMDKVGIEKRVILILDWGPELGEAKKSIWQIHEEILSICSRYSDRLIGFAGIDPRRPDATKVIAYAFDSLGARGLKFHPTGGWKLNDESTLKVVSLASERGFPVLVHIGKTVDILSDENARPHSFIQLAKAFPNIPFIAGHSGFDLWPQFLEYENLPKNIFFDISGWQERIQGNGENIIKDLIIFHDAFPGRVCFGTDSPFYGYNLVPSEAQWINRVIPSFEKKWAQWDVSKPELFDKF